jgi:hypothetical protein
LRAAWFLNRSERGGWWSLKTVDLRRSQLAVELFEERCHPNDLLGMSAVPIMGRWFASAAALDSEIAAAGLAVDRIAPGSIDLGSTGADIPAQPADEWFPQTAGPTRDIQTETPSPVPVPTTEQPSQHARFVPFAWGQSLVAASGILTDVLGSDPLDNGLDNPSDPPASAEVAAGPTQENAGINTTAPAAAPEAGGGGGAMAPTLQAPPAPVPATSPGNATGPTLNLSAAALPPSSGGRSATPNAGVMPPPALTVQFFNSAYCVTEGQGVVSVTAILSGTPTTTVTVNYATSNGSGLAGVDYGATAGTLTFMPGQSSAIFMVPILDDNQVGEASPETVNLSLSNPVGATLGTPHTAVLDIVEDNDVVPTVEFSSSSYNATEGQGPVGITAYLTGAPTTTVTVSYGTSDGTGIAGTDYGATAGTLTFGPGQSSTTFTVPILDDNQVGEASPETVNLTLSNPVGATLGSPSTATLAITEDNDVPPTVEFSNSSYSANEGQGLAGITAYLTGTPTQTVTVNYATSDGTGIAGTDYGATSGTLMFGPGQTSATFTVPILDDNQVGEASPETVNLTLSNPVGATLGTPSTATLDIVEDNDVLPTVQFSAATVNAGELQGAANVTVTLSPAGNQSVTVNYATSDGTGLAGTDYGATAGVLTFSPGQTIANFQVPILDDKLPNETSPETVNLTLSNPSGATLGSPSSAVLDINEDNSILTWSGPTFSWTQTTVTPPTVTSPGDQTNAEGDTVSLAIPASGPPGTTLTYDAIDLPDGLSIDASTGVISGTLTYQAAEDSGGATAVTVVVDTNQGGSATASFTWTINDTPRLPTLTNPGSQTTAAGGTVSLQVVGSQPDGDALAYDATGLPPGLSIDSTSGLISGTIPADTVLSAPASVTVTVTDESLNTPLTASQTFSWTVTSTNQAPVLTNPGDQTSAAGDMVSLAVAASDADGDTLTYTATGLPAGLSIDAGDGTITGTIANSAASATPYSVTVMASDGQSSSSQTFNWTVGAVSLLSPGNQTSTDGDTVSLTLAASDAGGLTLTYSASGLPTGLSVNSSSGVISGTIANTANSGSPFSVTVTASDGSSSASQSFTWTVARLTLNNPGNQQNAEDDTVSLQLSTTDVNGTPTYSATGLPAGLSISSSGLISGTIGASSSGSSPYHVTLTATDGGSTSSQSLVWTVTPRVILSNPGAQSSAEGDSVSLAVQAHDAGNATLTYSATGLPTGLSINSTSGVIAGTVPAGASAGSPYHVTVTAGDGTSSSSKSFAWAVGVVSMAAPADQTNVDGDSVSLALQGSYHGAGSLSYSATNLPPGLTINSSTGAISGTIGGSADTNSPYAVTVTATAGANSSSQTFNWTVTSLVAVDTVSNQTNAVGDAVSLAVSATDADNHSLTYSATGLPAGLSINSSTGVISGTVASGAETGSPYNVTVTAADGASSASQVFGWTAAHCALSNPGAQSSAAGASITLALQGRDADGDPVTFSATGLPPGLTLNSGTGVISGTLPSTPGTYQVTATASDGTASTSQTFVWKVAGVAVTAPANQTNTEGNTVSLQVSATTSSGTLTYSASGLPDGLSINAATGLISGTIAAGAASSSPLTVKVAASNGSVSASQTFTWTVNPRISLVNPNDQINTEGDTATLQINASEPGATLQYSAANLPSGLSIDSSTGLISGTVAAGDATSSPFDVTLGVSDGTYSSSQIFIWNVKPATAPAAPTLTNPGTITVNAGDAVSVALQATGPSGYTLTFDATGLPGSLTIDPGSGIISGTVGDTDARPTPYSVTVTVSDSAGASVSQTFALIVNAAPALSAQANPVSAVEGIDPGTLTLATFSSPDPNAASGDFAATIDWGDGSTDTGSVVGSSGSFSVQGDHAYAEKGTYTISVAITDDNGNTTTVTSTATVADANLTITDGFDSGALVNQSATVDLARFTDDNPDPNVSDFTVTIDWGDGSSSGGQLTSLGDDFVVSGTHTYNSIGTKNVHVTVTDVDGVVVTGSSKVEVGDLYAGLNSNLTVASFTDSNPNTTTADYTALIDWGDGTSSIGQVLGANGNYTVQGSHTYAQDSVDLPGGVYTVTVTVTNDDGNVATTTKAVEVVRPPINLETSDVSSGLTVNNAVLAVFTEADISDGPGEYTATIDWGDGTSSLGTITGGNGMFVVRGSHTYAIAGEYTATVTISQEWFNLRQFRARPVRIRAGILGGVPARLLAMQFNGGHLVASDITWGLYGPLQWLNGIGTPYSYARRQVLNVTAAFGLANPAWVGRRVFFRGVVNQPGFATVLQGSGVVGFNGIVIVNFVAPIRLPSRVWFFNNFRIQWFASATRAFWNAAGASANKIYLTYNPPPGALRMYETLAFLGCFMASLDPVNAAGLANARRIFSDLWRIFAADRAMRADGSPLTYYLNWINANGTVPTATTLPDLLRRTDGQCNTFADLLTGSILAQGLPPFGADGIGLYYRIQVRPTTGPAEAMLVKHWFFGFPNNPFNNRWLYPWVDLTPTTTMGLYPLMRVPRGYVLAGPVAYIGHLCQNNTFPIATFTNHVLNVVGNRIFDPSYGSTYANLADMQNQAIAGFYNVFGLQTPTALGRLMFIRRAPIARQVGGLTFGLQLFGFAG